MVKNKTLKVYCNITNCIFRVTYGSKKLFCAAHHQFAMNNAFNPN